MSVAHRCPTGSIQLNHHTILKVIPATCGRWNCGQCGPRKARRLRKRLAQTTPTRLITLTLRPDPLESPAEALKRANRAWSILWRRIRRKHGDRAVGYAKIVELTKAGTPHLHIIAEVPYIAQRELSRQWRELTGSYVVDIRKVRSAAGIGGYLTQYLTKALQVPPGMRKWSAANGWVPPEAAPELADGELPPVAVFKHASVSALLESLAAAGYTEHDGWLIPPTGQPPPT